MLLGVQARSNSTRLPGKIYKRIGGIEILEWVLGAAEKAAALLRTEYKIECEVAIVGPINDVSLRSWCKDHDVRFVGGPEEDLIARYVKAMEVTGCDYMVRITSDCWMLHPENIAIIVRLVDRHDYASNCITRTYEEGQDLQACSKEGLMFVDMHQTEKREHPFVDLDYNLKDREHFQSKGLSIVEMVDESSPIWTKTSIDTQEELDHMNRVFIWDTEGKREKSS